MFAQLSGDPLSPNGYSNGVEITGTKLYLQLGQVLKGDVLDQVT